MSSSDLGTRVLRKCLYFLRRGQGGRISSHNTRHMCQRQNYATIPLGEGTQIFRDSRLQVSGLGDRASASHDGAEETHLCSPLPPSSTSSSSSSSSSSYSSSAIAMALLSPAAAAASRCPPQFPSLVEDLFLPLPPLLASY